MHEPGILDLVFFTAVFSVMGWILVSQIRYALKRRSSRRWPITNAVIEPLHVGKFMGFKVHAGFFNYRFVIQNSEYRGRFLIIDNEEHASGLQNKLNDTPIDIRYDPNNPCVSFIVKPYDPRFEGHAARQNPYWFYWTSGFPNFQSLNLKR